MIGRGSRGGVLVAVGVALALLASACGDDSDDSGEAGAGNDEWPDELVFAAVPAEESTSLLQSYQHHVDVLEEQLGLEVEFSQAADYAGVIEGQIAGRVHIAQYGPFSYVIAKDQGAAIEPAGAMLDTPDGEPGYQSYGIVPAGSEISSLEEFAGRDVCFVDASSTSGYLYPSQGLLDAGIDPDEDVTPTLAGGHDASVIAVANGDCDAGFAYDAMVDEIVIDQGDIDEGDVEVVWESEIIAGSPLAVSTDLPADLIEEIHRIITEELNVDSLVEAGACEDLGELEETVSACGLSDENVWGYAAVEDSYYDGVRAVCEATEAEACEEG